MNQPPHIPSQGDSRDDAWLDAVVHAAATNAHVADAGFTDEVLAQLPRRRRRRRLGVREAALSIAALAAGGVGFAALDGARPLILTSGSSAQLLAAAVVVGLALWGALAADAA